MAVVVSPALRSQTLVALTPQDVAPAQASLAAWCVQKIRSLAAEHREVAANVRIAKEHKWRHSGIQKMLPRLRARMHYYRKIQAAVEAGYLVVPNFEVEVMAVRVRDDGQDPPWITSKYKHDHDVLNAVPDRSLPIGEGRYVDETHKLKPFAEQEADGKGGLKSVTHYGADKYQVPDFPVKLVKPIILHATQRAMALKIFDRIGVVTGKQTDPVVVGQIINPEERWLHLNLRSEKRVSFFIAWWLDPETL